MIYILTGKVRTGKTTTLLDWSKSRNNVDGVLCPDDKEGKRFFLNIGTNETYNLETKDEKEEAVIVGPYRFFKASFNQADNYLLQINFKKEFKYLIIDELGKLELKNQGLHKSAKQLIPQFLNNKNHHLILVVRESLLEKIVKHYEIKECTIIKKEELKELN